MRPLLVALFLIGCVRVNGSVEPNGADGGVGGAGPAFPPVPPSNGARVSPPEGDSPPADSYRPGAEADAGFRGAGEAK